MNKNNGSYQEGGGGVDDGLKDMDGLIDYSSHPFPFSTFCDDEDMNGQRIVKREVRADSGVGGGGGVHGGGGGGEIYHSFNDDDDGVNDTSSMFYNDFPPIPEFPCMSSSSSSSSAPVLSKPVASTSSSSSSASSSSATSWTVFKPDSDEYIYNNSEDGRYHRYQYHHHHSNDYIQGQKYDNQAAAGLSSTASKEISFPPPDGSNTNNDDADCINVMESFGYMDLLDTTDIWDPSSVFEGETENPQEQGQEDDGFYQLRQNHTSQVQKQKSNKEEEDGNGGLYFLQGSRELGDIFLDWLKQNKDYISAEDMRSIKLKRSTIDCALKRLGTTKEGQKQLLKLILEWVEQYQLQKKRTREIDHQQILNPNPNVDLNCNPIPSYPNNCFSTSATWAQPPSQPPFPPPCVQEAGSLIPTTFPPVMGIPGGAYPCDIPYSAPVYSQAAAEQYQSAPMDVPTQSWNMAAAPSFAVAPHPQYNPFPDASATIVPGSNHSHSQAQSQAMYVNAYPYPVFDNNTGGRLVRSGPSVTREARKKRMARQRRIYIHQYHRHHRNHHRGHSNNGHHHNQQPQDLLMTEQQAAHAAAVAAAGGGGGGGCVEDSIPSQANPNGNWIYWSPAAVAAPPVTSTVALVPPVIEPSHHVAQARAPVNRGTMQPESHQQCSQVSSADRKQGLKTGKNLKFLLQKVLKQSDVGNLGRIVLPKKEAETHLPELESRDGICLAMEDIGTSNVWNMRYRFWPNNKSRMYLLENTGDFVRVNGLQEGDFIVIYSDTRCGKYLIRGVKVRQTGSKPEAKKQAKKNQRNEEPPPPACNFSLASFEHLAK